MAISEKFLQKYRYFIDMELSEDIRTIAKVELNETLEKTDMSLQMLKEMIKSKKEITLLEDEELIKFLRIAKFDEEKAYKRMKNTSDIMNKHSEIINNYYLIIKSKVPQNIFYYLPYRNTDNSTIAIIRNGLWDPSKITYEQAILYLTMLIEAFIHYPVNQICGYTLIFDCFGFNLQHLIQLTPKTFKMHIDFVQNTIPIRYKIIHLINAPRIAIMLYNTLKPLLPSKLKKRLIFHSIDPEYQNLHKYISPDILPENYGGKLPQMNGDLYQTFMKENNIDLKNSLMTRINN